MSRSVGHAAEKAIWNVRCKILLCALHRAGSGRSRARPPIAKLLVRSPRGGPALSARTILLPEESPRQSVTLGSDEPEIQEHAHLAGHHLEAHRQSGRAVNS